MKPKTGKKVRLAKHGKKVNVNNLDFEHFYQVEKDKGIIAYSVPAYSKALSQFSNSY